ncbi:MAG: AMP-binding protein, partial [Chloroflexota bacterium]|nr:AMP-binding protein [Chloroflexota bacterium]
MTTLDGVTAYPPEFVARYRALGFWEDRSLAQFFDAICTQFSSRTALVADGESITYQQLATHAERLALHLLKLGLRPLDRLVMQLPNTPEFVYLYFALQKIGVIPVMALAGHRYAEIQHFVTLSEAVGYAIPERIGDFSFAELATRIHHEHHDSLRWIFVGGQTDQPGWVSLSELLQTESGLPRERLTEIAIDPTLPALFQLSGGTTGVPKLIPRTHNDYLYNSKAAAAINDI